MASITQLEYVIALDQTRHFGRASELCHVSQPTLSAQILRLEEELGVVLFDRNKQPILPTEEGRELIEQARLIVNEHRRLVLMAQKKTDSLEGEFKLAVIPTVAPYLVPSLMRKFNESYPQVFLSIEEMSSADIIESLDKDLLDAGILATPLGLSRIAEEPLYYESFFLYVHTEHPFARLEKVSEHMLKSEDLWLPSEEHCLRAQALQICKLDSQGGCFPTIKIKGAGLETIIGLVESGQGYTLLPELAANQIKERKMRGQIVKISRPAPAREISLAHRRGHLKQGILKALKLAVDASVPASLAREKSKAFRVLGLSGDFQ